LYIPKYTLYLYQIHHMKDKIRIFGAIVILFTPGLFFITYPKIDSIIGINVFLFLFFVSVIETFKTIKYFHEK